MEFSKNWPEDSKHYMAVPTWWDKHPDRTPNDYRDPWSKPSTKCKDAYIRDFGPFENEAAYLKSVGEIDLTREIH